MVINTGKENVDIKSKPPEIMKEVPQDLKAKAKNKLIILKNDKIKQLNIIIKDLQNEIELKEHYKNQ